MDNTTHRMFGGYTLQNLVNIGSDCSITTNNLDRSSSFSHLVNQNCGLFGIGAGTSHKIEVLSTSIHHPGAETASEAAKSPNK